MKSEEGAEVAVDMSSLVDMSFLLLVFFLVTTTIVARESDLPMMVPTEGAPSELRPLTIRVEPDNRVVLHPGQSFEEEVAAVEEGRELEVLRERLAVLKSARQGVRLDVLDGASYQRFVDVLNCLRGEGWDEVAITQL